MKTRDVYNTIRVFGIKSRRLFIFPVLQLCLVIIDVLGVFLLGLFFSEVSGLVKFENSNSDIQLRPINIPFFGLIEAWQIFVISISLILARSILSPILSRQMILEMSDISKELSTITFRESFKNKRRDSIISNQEFLQMINQGTYSFVLSIFYTQTWIIESVFLIGVLISLIPLIPLLPASVLLLILIISYKFQLLIRRRLFYLSTKHVESLNNLNNFTDESLRLKDEIYLSKRETFFGNIYRNWKSQDAKLTAELQFLYQMPRSIFEITALIALIAMAGVLVALNQDFDLIIGYAVTYLLLFFRLLPTLLKIQLARNSGKQAIAYSLPFVKYIYDVSISPTITIPKFSSSNTVEARTCRHSLVCENVEFTYNGLDSLKYSNFAFSEDGITAIRGPSGVGKSTLGKLLCGLLEPTAGQITLNGVSVLEIVTSESNTFHYLSSNTSFFPGTLRDNITFGVAIEDQIILDLILKLELVQWYETQPFGLDTHITNFTIGLSLGQRQRLGIVRAILSNPKILVLDEATNSLPVALEHRVLNLICLLLQETKVIFITHRSEYLTQCKQIIQL